MVSARHSLVMKRLFSLRAATWLALVVCAGSSVSCMTTYDAYGQPVQSVDPVAAAAGIAAAGLIGYSIAENRSHRHYGYARPYWGGGCGAWYGGGYYRPCY